MKKIKIILVFIIFGLSLILHFIYGYIPNTIISILAPVNESIWEHMKLIITSSLLGSVLEYCIYKKKDIAYNNFILSYAISSILSIILYLVIYIPLNDMFGHSFYIAIILLFLIFIFLQYISYLIMNRKNIIHSNDIGVLLIIIIYFIFGYFTYNPPKINLFYDYMNHGFGIIESSLPKE